MPKITFLGAGSTIFAKNVLGDCLLTSSLREAHIALYDIDGKRLRQSKTILDNLNRNINKERARITAHCGERSRKTALRDADYVINAVQIGPYDPSTLTDYEIPKKYGLSQTIADTLGIGGISRALRTLPVMLDFARDMEAVCPNAWLLNYTNPMSILTGGMLRLSSVKTVGLCHSVQVCANALLTSLGVPYNPKRLHWKIAGINHMAWLLELTEEGKDLYPLVKKRAAQRLRKELRDPNAEKNDLVRLEMMMRFGHYVTESSKHNAEYAPYWIRRDRPDLVEAYGIVLDDHQGRRQKQQATWEELGKKLLNNPNPKHKRSHEYAAGIMAAMETDVPARIHGNVLNAGFIPNLPAKAIVEVPCLVDRNGINGCHVGELPEQCAALNRTNINVHLLTIEALATGRRDHIYHAAMLDPHTAAELTIDEIRKLCDDLIDAHGNMIPNFKQ